MTLHTVFIHKGLFPNKQTPDLELTLVAALSVTSRRTSQTPRTRRSSACQQPGDLSEVGGEG